MTVYVDNMLRPARVGRLHSRWSHLMADTHEELEAFARELHLKPEWIQHPGTHREHYDLTEGKRIQALGFGAVAIDYPHGTGRVLAAKKAAAADELWFVGWRCGCTDVKPTKAALWPRLVETPGSITRSPSGRCCRGRDSGPEDHSAGSSGSAGIAIRVPTSSEQVELDGDPNVRAALAAMAEAYTPSQASALRWGTT